MRRALAAAAVVTVGLCGCTGTAPPPGATLSCLNTEHVGGDFEYLNCVRGETTPPVAQAAGPGTTRTQ